MKVPFIKGSKIFNVVKDIKAAPFQEITCILVLHFSVLSTVTPTAPELVTDVVGWNFSFTEKGVPIPPAGFSPFAQVTLLKCIGSLLFLISPVLASQLAGKHEAITQTVSVCQEGSPGAMHFP